MRKRILALALACALLMGTLAACGSASSSGSGGGVASAGGTSDGGADSGEITTIVLAFTTWSGAPQDLALVQEAMNQISRAKIGVEAELLVTDFGSYMQQMTLMLSGNEQLDIMSGLAGGDLFGSAIRNGQLMDLEHDGLLETYGAGIIENVGMDIINACRVGGVLYGLPCNRGMAQGKGCYAVRTDLLQAIGFEVDTSEDITFGTMEDIHYIFAQIHEQFPEIETYRPVTGTLQQNMAIDYLGGNVYGVLMDPANSLEVVNFFETEEYLAYCKMVRGWYEAGYISQDAATDTTAVGDLTMAGQLAAYNTGGKPGIKAQESALCGYDMTIIQTGNDFMSSASVAGFPWTITENTVDAVAAMKYLDLLYSDADMMNLICWGIEGVHYEKTETGLLDYPAGVDASSSGYNHSMNWMFPNQYLLEVWTGDSPDLWDQMRAFNNDSVKSKALGFTFESGNVSTEMSSVANVYEEYQKSIEFGLMDSETGIAEMNRKLEAAGLGVIIAEKQAQLDAWVAAGGGT